MLGQKKVTEEKAARRLAPLRGVPAPLRKNRRSEPNSPGAHNAPRARSGGSLFDFSLSSSAASNGINKTRAQGAVLRREARMPRAQGCAGAAIVRISYPSSSKWVAKECRSVWQLAGLKMRAARSAFLTAFCGTDSSQWWRRTILERGSTDRLEAGKIYCQPHCLPALGYLRSSA